MKKSNALERVLEAYRGKNTDEPTEQKIASVLGVSQPSVHGWKSGNISLKVAQQAAVRFGVCVEWLMTGRGPKFPNERPDPSLAELHQIWHTLSERQRKRITDFARFTSQNPENAE